MEYLRYFESESAYTESRNNDYVEPWVSLTDAGSVETVNYNKTEEEKALEVPLTFNIMSDGDIKFRKNSSYFYRLIKLQYKINDGEWSSFEATTTAKTINVSSGDTVQFKSQDGWVNKSFLYSTSVYASFSGSSAYCTVSGNIMSLIDGENFPTIRTLDSAETGQFANIFSQVTNLTSAADLILPINTTRMCYQSMFARCTKLTDAPKLPATILDNECYATMFSNCSSLTVAPEIHATTVGASSCRNMFDYCTGLTTAQERLSATTIGGSCYYNMFSGCKSLTKAPELPATTLAPYCYYGMFSGCTSLNAAPELPATTLAEGCYNNMFSSCNNITGATKTLPATTLPASCYNSMFRGCTKLITAPEICGTTLSGTYCCNAMFSGCTSLTTVQVSLPAMTLSEKCYYDMFNRCSSITTAPALPATTLGNYCYSHMFYGCTSLTTAPALPATTLASNCYEYMFAGCSQIVSAPELLAATLVSNCYIYMFNQCSSLNYIKCSATNPQSGYTNNWVQGVSRTGTFYSSVEDWIRGSSGIPTDWGIKNKWTEPLKFEIICGGTITWNYYSGAGARGTGDTLFVYMNGASNYTQLAPNSSLNVNAGDYFTVECWKAEYNPSDSCSYAGPNLEWYSYFSTSNGCKFKLSGNIMSMMWQSAMLNDYGEGPLYKSLPIWEGESYSDVNHFAYLFANCTGLISISDLLLPAVNRYDGEGSGYAGHDGLSSGCYQGMFSGCTSLVDIVSELPATILADNSYKGMFAGCVGITGDVGSSFFMPETLGDYCCQDMFAGCTGITGDVYLPAETLVTGCYNGMFSGCSSIEYISCYAQNPGASYTQNWVYGVAGYGQFNAASGTCEDWPEGANGIPIGWEANCGEG